ncbi:MAG: choice-of-anchor J domain-containing protein [Ignavibacteriales bacterium]|nr:choice-of-anchor J domain-containing protein [Ignavibacteriales bacterium]
MKKLFLVVFTLFFVTGISWAQNGAEKNVTGKTYTTAEKMKIDLLGYPATDWSQGNPHHVTGIVKWSQGFEDATFPPTGWAVHQLDGGANTWLRYTSAPIFGTASASVRWESGTLANDDWLVTPSFLVDAADKLNFYAVGSSSYTDSVIVYASTTGGVPPTGYTRIAAFRPLAAPAQRFEVSLAAFGGQTIYLAFQYKELDMLRLYLDSVYVETGVPNDVGMVSHNVGGEMNAGAFTPMATVKNFGSATQTFNVTMTINPGGYTSTKTVTGLAADQSQDVTFDSWTAGTGSFVGKAYTQLAGDQNPANDTLSRTALIVEYIYDNGPLLTNPGGGFGGADLSALQATTLNILGNGVQVTANNWLTDDFTVPANESWSIDAFKFFSYQTGSTTTPTYTGARVVIYNGRPDLPTSTIVFGDETTERFVGASWTGMYRATDAAPTGNTRPIMGILANAPVVLQPGNYWVLYALAGTLSSGPWTPPISIIGTFETGNSWARQSNVWLPFRDSAVGAPSGYAQGLPFKIVGNVQPVPVELTSFIGTVIKNDVTLAWTTATETNNMGFEVERKSTTGSFEKVGYVSGNGTTTQAKEYAFIDAGLASGKYSYRLKQVDFDGTSEYSNAIEVDVNVPSEYSLTQNFPNPFNPSTSIQFALKSDAKVTLRLFDALGQEVRTILNDNYATGNYKIDFNATGLNSGVYFYTIDASGVDGSKFTATKKMILMK